MEVLVSALRNAWSAIAGYFASNRGQRSRLPDAGQRAQVDHPGDMLGSSDSVAANPAAGINAGQLSVCTGATITRATQNLAAMNAAMAEFGIDTKVRRAMFLANVGHECGGFLWASEIWGPTEAQKRYEGRKDLGNTVLGDGFFFRGRGWLQTTGRGNYQRVSDALGIDYVAHPDWLSRPVDAARSAGYFWQSNNLNRWADAGDFVGVVRKINGGTNGLVERQRLYDKAMAVLR